MIKSDNQIRSRKKISQISISDLIGIIISEHACLDLESWEKPEIQYITDMLIKDTIIIEFNQKNKKDDLFSSETVFYLNFACLSIYWHLKDSESVNLWRKLKIETIKFLIEKGYQIVIGSD